MTEILEGELKQLEPDAPPEAEPLLRQVEQIEAATSERPLQEGERFLMPHQMQAAVDMVVQGMQKKVNNPNPTNKDTYTEILGNMGALRKHTDGTEVLADEDREKISRRLGELMGSVVDRTLAREDTPDSPNLLARAGVKYAEIPNKPKLAGKVFLEAAQRFYSDIARQLDPLLAREVKHLTGIERKRMERLQQMLVTYEHFGFEGGKPEDLFGTDARRGEAISLDESEVEGALAGLEESGGRNSEVESPEKKLEELRVRLAEIEAEHRAALEQFLADARTRKLAELRGDLEMGPAGEPGQ